MPQENLCKQKIWKTKKSYNGIKEDHLLSKIGPRLVYFIYIQAWCFVQNIK